MADDDAENVENNEEEDETPEEQDFRLASEAYIAALIQCGITSEGTLEYLRETQLQVTIESLATLSQSEIKDMVYLTNKTPSGARARGAPNHVITAIAFKRLKAFREWIKWRKAMLVPVRAHDFTIQEMEWAVDRMDFEARVTSADAVTVSLPNPLKTTGHKDWIPFWRQFQNYCQTIRGALSIPIGYVFRDSAEPAGNLLSDDYDTSDQALSACVALSGTFYTEDNARVWDILETLTCDGNTYSFIKRFKKTRDGRGALLILRGQCEGLASVETRKKAAYSILNTQIYDGKGRFTYEHYVEKLQFAFSELEECGDPQSESHKIFVLTTNCVNPLLTNCVDDVMGDSVRFSTFAFACEYIKGQNERKMTPKQVLERRNISSITTDPDTDDYQGLKTVYSPEEWKALPQATKSRVIKRNKERKAASKKATSTAPTSSGGTTLKSKDRRIKSLEKKLAAFKSVSTTADGSDSDEDDPQGDSDTTVTKSNSTNKRNKQS